MAHKVVWIANPMIGESALPHFRVSPDDRVLVFFRDRGLDKVDSACAMKNLLGVEAQGGRTCGAARAGSELELPRITLENIDK
jgi:hypothetical protein